MELNLSKEANQFWIPLDEYFAEADIKEGLAEVKFLKAICHCKHLEGWQKSQDIQCSFQAGENDTVNRTASVQSDSFSQNASLLKHHSNDSSLQQILSQSLGIQSFGLNNKLAESQKMRAEFQEAMRLLEQSRTHFSEFKLGAAKTWLIQADLLLDKLSSVDELKEEVSAHISDLHLHLHDACEIFYQNEYYTLYAKCLLQLAKAEYLKESFITSREYLIKCLNLSSELQISKTQKEAKTWFEAVSVKIQIKFNNVFTFAKAFPIAQMLTMLSPRQITDSRDQLIAALHSTQKQIDLKFEVLTDRFLHNLRDSGTKVLHLTPSMFRIESNQQEMILEDDNLNVISLTPQQLLNILKPDSGQLNIYLVVIELTNCQEFCKVFRELGVQHVISFTYKAPRAGSSLHEDVHLNTQYQINLV